ncbi:MAG: 23S rRNA (uracil(1939)-C(5))-methyltransferase RlmD [Eubacteriales bacterium]
MASIPVKAGQTIKTHIVSINAQGQGVAKVEGYVVFVNNALPGEDCTIRITKVLTKYAHAKVLARENYSKLRVEPKCAHYDKCGGCQLQHIGYKGQLLLKQKNVIDAFNKSRLDVKEKIMPTIGMNRPWNYRNKVIFNVQKSGENAVMGMYGEGSHRMTEIDKCYIIDEHLNVLLPVVRSHLKYLYAKEALNTLPFDKVFGRVGKDKQMMAGFISKDEIHRYIDSLVVNLRRANNDIVSIFQNKSYDDSGNLSRENTFLWGRESIEGEIGEMEFDISPNSFFQINTVQTQKLYEIVRDCCSLEGDETIFDLYCGVGTIGMYVAKDAKKVYGIESVVDAVEDAQKNAKRNNVRNIEFLKGDCEKMLPSLLNSEIYPDVAIIDPPRKGCSNKFLDVLSKTECKRIVYVSCNPATLARDAKILSDRGYNVEKIQPVDMFPHTYHVECVCFLSKQS